MDVTYYTIRLDDADRADCPDSPWTATFTDPTGNTVIDAGVGRRPIDALHDLIKNAQEGPLA